MASRALVELQQPYSRVHIFSTKARLYAVAYADDGSCRILAFKRQDGCVQQRRRPGSGVRGAAQGARGFSNTHRPSAKQRPRTHLARWARSPLAARNARRPAPPQAGAVPKPVRARP